MTKRVAIFSFVDHLKFSALLSVARGFEWSLNFDSETKTTLFCFCASYFNTLVHTKTATYPIEKWKKMTVAPTFMARENENQAKLTCKVLSLERAQSSSLRCHTSPPQTRGGAGERDVWIPSVKMPSGDVTYFCEYGRYFLIGFYLSEIENLLLAVVTLQTFYL